MALTQKEITEQSSQHDKGAGNRATEKHLVSWIIRLPFEYDESRAAFASLIDKVSGRGIWESNPLVWVYSFELVD